MGQSGAGETTSALEFVDSVCRNNEEDLYG